MCMSELMGWDGADRRGPTQRGAHDGDSVIDWHRLAFSEHAEVDRFLRLNEFDPDSDDELARLEE